MTLFDAACLKLSSNPRTTAVAMNGHSPSDSPPDGGDPHGRPVRRTALPRWRFLALARIKNFVVLRRHLGRARVSSLPSDLVDVMSGVLPDARIEAIGRDLIEIAFESESRSAIDKALNALDRSFAGPLAIDGEEYNVEFVWGASASEGSLTDEIRMVEQAEQALLDTDSDRRLVIHDAGAAQRAVDRIALARDLDRAIARGELFLQYQPKMHVRRQAIASVEALIRWRHPERGLVLPGDFIPLAEETRVINALTLWTIRQALTDQAVLAKQGYDLRVFVNIAGVLLSDEQFVKEAGTLLRDKADKIGFEVTETSVIRDPESAIANLQTFADLGVEIAIDDYGAGLSSLAYLKRLPARELKIDKLFVTQLTSSNRDPLIVRSTIDLAHALEMEVVAEGVETQAALALLSVMGCDMIQGFLISRPVGLNALIAYLQDKRHTEAIEESRATFNRLAASWTRG